LLRSSAGRAAGSLESGRAAVYGCTDDEPGLHFIGWVDEVDADALFASGRAWGIQVVRRP